MYALRKYKLFVCNIQEIKYFILKITAWIALTLETLPCYSLSNTIGRINAEKGTVNVSADDLTIRLDQSAFKNVYFWNIFTLVLLK